MAGPITGVEAYRLRLPLITPYRLAFGVVEAYDTIVVSLRDADGCAGLGEATILAGYSDETIDESWPAIRELCGRVAGAVPPSLVPEVLRLGIALPFAATALGTAIEMLCESPILRLDHDVRVPLAGLLSAKDEEALEREFEHQLAEGYRTVKVKVGFDVAQDTRFVKTVQRVVRGRALIRIDANQGYSADQGRDFVRMLDPADIELFEQPCKAGDWDSHLAVVRASPVPMMLDESIHCLADIEKAASLRAAAFIKLKLMKLVSMQRLREAIERIKALGMIPVLGNGVATDLGCWMEGCISATDITNAGEMNGFLKTRVRLLAGDLEMHSGVLHLQAGFAPTLNLETVERYAVDAVSAGVADAAIPVRSP